jgi:hypothetical protein
MSEQPDALWLADQLGARYSGFPSCDEAAAELRRLHAVNAELLQALKDATDAIEHWGTYSSDYFQKKWDLQSDINAARAAIARAEGQT